MKNFISKNKVLFAALVSALILVLQQAMTSQATDWKAIGWAALIALLGVIGNQWKGKGISVTGIIGTLAYNFTTIYQSGGKFSWDQFILTSVIALLMVLSASLAPEAETPSKTYR